MRRVIVRTAARVLLRRRIFNGNRERIRDLFDAGHPIRWAWHHHRTRSERTAAIVERYPQLHVERFQRAADVDAWLGRLEAQRA
jgi:hypothetical protein